MTCGNDLINSQLVTPLAREAEQCAHTGNLNQTPSQTNSSQRKVKLKKHITLMIRCKLKVLTLHSLSFLSFLCPVLSIKWIALVDSYCDSWVKLKIILGWLFWKTEQMPKITTTLQIFTPWKLQGLGITGSLQGKPILSMEKGCKNHKETLCTLWINPVVFTDCGETPW